MRSKISFGLVEIFGIFGCYSLVTQNYSMGAALTGLALFGSFFRYAIDLQQKKENNQKIEDGLKSLKDAFGASKAAEVWSGFKPNNTTAH